MTRDSIGSNNRKSAIAVGALGAAAGSILTIMLVISTVWAVFGLLRRHFPYVITRADLVVLIPASLFVFVQMTFALIHYTGEPGKLFHLAGPLVLFLSGWLLIPRLRAGSENTLDLLVLGSGFCAPLGLPIATVQILLQPLGFALYPVRAEGGAGNSLPFAFIVTVFGAIALFNLVSEDRRRRILGWVSLASAFGCILMSGTLSMLPVLAVLLVYFLILSPSVLRQLVTPRALVIIGLSLVLLAFPMMLWLQRFSFFIDFVRKPQEKFEFTTFNERLRMWQAGWDLFCESPLLGHGIEHRSEMMFAKIGIAYTHFHNGFLTILVDAGVIGLATSLLMLAAPVLMCRFYAPENESDTVRTLRFYIALVVCLSYFASAITNIMFMHDIYDSVYLWLVALLAASVPPGGVNSLVFGKNGKSI